MENLFENIAHAAGAESFVDLLTRPGLRIERIVSTGQATPPGQLLKQAWDEWVLLLTGAAGLWMEGANERRLAPGDHLLIHAGRPHRVTWTDPGRETIWLAVHMDRGQGVGP